MRTFDRNDPGASYRVRLTYDNGTVRLLGPWEKFATAKSIRTREVNYAARYIKTCRIVDAVVERATGWEAVE